MKEQHAQFGKISSRSLRKNVKLLLDFQMRSLRTKRETFLGVELNRLYNKLVSS